MDMYSLVLYNIDTYSVELCGKLGFGWGEAAGKDPSQLNTHPRLHCPFSEDHTSLLLVLEIIITTETSQTFSSSQNWGCTICI